FLLTLEKIYLQIVLINAQEVLRVSSSFAEGVSASKANAAKQTLPKPEPDDVLERLAQTSQGIKILTQFNQFLEDYGYLSEVGTDIAVPTWKENPQVVRELFVWRRSL
ncbi:MAG: hypothetical protein AAFX80_20325, partial [Cyanobacteria bacterium J06639_18]